MRKLQDSDKKQKTKPERGKAVEIPVPKRGDVLGALKKVAKTDDKQEQ